MKRVKYIICAAAMFSLASCHYLNVDDYFEDTFQEDQIFASKTNADRYFNGALDLLPKEGRIWHWSTCPGVTGSDEAISCGSYSNGFLEVSFAGTNILSDRITTTSMNGWEWDLNIWDDSYKVIRKMNTMLPRIDEVPDMDFYEKSVMKGECRFLRAYAYLWILNNQGPMIIVGDQVYDTNREPEYYTGERNTYDECVDYICSEFEKASEVLPLTQTTTLINRPSRGAALALVARLRLEAASPLFNGGSVARRYFGNFTRQSDGVHYISQVYDERKWAVAAAAAKRVIDLDQYELHYVERDEETTRALPDNVPSDIFPAGAGGIDPFRSYSEMFTGQSPRITNKEIIWAVENGEVAAHLDYIFPLTMGGTNALSVPQRIVDAFYMADGRDINNSSPECPYENEPFNTSCVVANDTIISQNYIVKGGTYKAFWNREARFYANIAFSGRHWPMKSTSEASRKDLTIKYHYGAPYGRNAASSNNYYVYNLTGYTSSKYIHPDDAKQGAGNRIVAKVFPLIRYAEILLSYAEALNNLTTTWEIDGENYYRNTSIMREAFNPVRYRAGLPGVNTVELESASQFQKVIERERLIELFHENRRYYDIRRWGIMEELENQPLTGLNVELGEWNGFYMPTAISHTSIRERQFNPRMIFAPLNRNELRKAPTIDQNPGWDD